MTAGRRGFFDAGHFQLLADRLAEIVASFFHCPRTEIGWWHRFVGHGGTGVRFLPPEVFLDVLRDFLRGLYPSSP
jgi:hypothetical protein